GVASADDASLRDPDPLRAQQDQLSPGQMGSRRAVGADHAMPGQTVAALGEDAADQAGGADTGPIGHLSVAEHLALRDRRDHVSNALHDLVIHPRPHLGSNSENLATRRGMSAMP